MVVSDGLHRFYLRNAPLSSAAISQHPKEHETEVIILHQRWSPRPSRSSESRTAEEDWKKKSWLIKNTFLRGDKPTVFHGGHSHSVGPPKARNLFVCVESNWSPRGRSGMLSGSLAFNTPLRNVRAEAYLGETHGQKKRKCKVRCIKGMCQDGWCRGGGSYPRVPGTCVRHVYHSIVYFGNLGLFSPNMADSLLYGIPGFYAFFFDSLQRFISLLFKSGFYLDAPPKTPGRAFPQPHSRCGNHPRLRILRPFVNDPEVVSSGQRYWYLIYILIIWYISYMIYLIYILLIDKCARRRAATWKFFFSFFGIWTPVLCQSLNRFAPSFRYIYMYLDYQLKLYNVRQNFNVDEYYNILG